MNDKDNLNKSLINEFSVPIYKRACCYYILCFCLCDSEKKTNSRNYYINKWRKYLSKEADSKNKQNDPFRILTNLWAHKNVVKDLELIRLNPNLLNKKHIRNDLEFYIPQLCTFMLFGDYETVEEFLAFLCKACFASFSFAHRIVWFLKSLINPYNPQNEKIRTILHLIQTIFKSENTKQILERLHVPGSKKFVEYLNNTKQIEIYDNNLKLKNEEAKVTRKNHVREMLDNYVDRQYNEILKENEEIDVIKIQPLDSNNEKSRCENEINAKSDISLIYNEFNLEELKLVSEDIFINIFKRYDSVTNDENNINIQYVKQIDMDDINLSSFLSNVNFVDNLCNICEILGSTHLNHQNKTLINELRKVNKVLPGNLYLPFNKDSIRNYAIASIPLSEVKIFRTKNRAPYLITFECFRLDELTFNLLNHKETSNISSSNSSSNDEDDNLKTSEEKRMSKSTSKNQDRTTKKSQPRIKDDFGLRNNNLSFKSSLLAHEDKVNDTINKTENVKLNKSDGNIENLNKSYRNDFLISTKDRNHKTFSEPSVILDERRNSKSTFDRMGKLNYLLESDVNISKPVIIKNIINPERNHKEIKTNKIRYNTMMKLDYETDPEDFKKIEKKVVENSHIKNDDISNSQNISKNIPNKFKNDDNLIFKENNSTNQIDDFKILKKGNSPIFKSRLIENESDENNEEIILSLHKDEFDKDSIFGEKIEEQTERLKKISPFGFFDTYKLFKIIVKSGEDLRQEQFATQLINEFYQIFKMEKVECWVNPYEIIATGNNCGIIEVVPNSVSIDQLKRKSKLNSLKNFYDTYFAPVKSKTYKKAMKNFISSLAGYSLVCYFLQLKDRHNGNILIDDQGRIIHIDFGFMLSNAPGKGLQFEKAPFKLTKEFVDVMGGVNSKYFTKFRKLLWKGFIAIINNYEKILILVEMMYCGHGNKLPCFEKGKTIIKIISPGDVAINELRTRFIPRPNMKTRDYIQHVDSLIEQSIDNWRTKWYDKYQYWVQGIFY